MRAPRYAQLPFTLIPQTGEQFREYEKTSEVLDQNPAIEELVYADLTRGIDPTKGCQGLSAEQVFRALLVKQQEGFSYERLAFLVNDAATFRWFCRLQPNQVVTKSTLQRGIQKIRPETLEKINGIIVRHAMAAGIETGRKVRTDCTAVETNIHEPSDSMLLWDCVRVLTRCMKEAKKKFPQLSCPDHTRRAKRRAFAIQNAKRMAKRIEPYRDLLKVTRKTLGYANRALELLRSRTLVDDMISQLSHYAELTEKVIAQTQRRVLDKESVPAEDKVLSIFEPHTDIIKKDSRQPVFGHKVCMTAGASGLILDCQILDGNPADANLTTEMIERVIEVLGKAPRQATFDGAFSSKENLAAVKEKGLKDVVFSKSRGIEIEDMAKSTWVYKQLRRFRAGIEGIISLLKRSFGLARCTWHGLTSFKSYVWGSIVSANLLGFARHALRQ